MHTDAAARTHIGVVVISIAMLASACSAASSGSAAPTPTAVSSVSAPATASASISATASPGAGPLTEAEIDRLTGGARVPIPAAAPPPMTTAAAAEAIVRGRYPGQRTTIGVIRVAMNFPATSGLHTGWFVALTPADGQACNLHAGFLPRAIEGGVVDDQTGDFFWVFLCGP